MIKIDNKPVKTVFHGKGEIELDRVYTFSVIKSINGKTEYTVELDEEVDEAVKNVVVGAVVNYCLKNGIFEPKKE